MNKKNTILFLSALLITSCQNMKSEKQNDSSASGGVNKSSLNYSMQGLKDSLSKLLPLVVNPQKFNDPANKDEIDKSLNELVHNSKNVVHNSSIQYRDPSLRFLSNAFSEDVERVKEGLATGKREYARYTLMNITSYCIECHTRTSMGPSFNLPDLEKSLSTMKAIDKAEFLVATRQFDKAQIVLSEVIKEGLSDKNMFFELDRAVRYAMAVTVKFQNDPKKAMGFVETINQSKTAPFYLKQSANSWSMAIKEWMKEKNVKLSNASDLLIQSRNLVKKGRAMQMGSADRGGDVYFMRALSELHKLLNFDLNKEQLGEALYLTGVSYESVRDLAVWTLHENYYESCIRQVPHTNWSQSCFKKLEESVYFGYTGSSGVRVPMDVQLKMQELQKLALPEIKH